MQNSFGSSDESSCNSTPDLDNTSNNFSPMQDDIMEIEEETQDFTENTEQPDVQLTTDEVKPIELMVNDDDPYKAEATITFKLKKFSHFVNNLGYRDENRIYSPYVSIRGVLFRLLVLIRRPYYYNDPKCLGVFLQCEVTSHTWKIDAFAILRLHRETSEPVPRVIVHEYSEKENDWGFSTLIRLQELFNPAEGYIKDDTLTLSAEIYADPPRSILSRQPIWNSKLHTGHVGLKNQGATCYMNSILQTLFFTNKLRKAVYQMPTENDDPENSVALAMQRVFYELQFSDLPVLTRKLTKSFGWDSLDSFLQHDVQELCRVLLDNLESKMKSTQVADTIPNLFRGRMKSYVKCKKVDFESSREEPFYDVQLNVKDITNVMDSFRDYTQVEVLDGENKYDAGEYGLQVAEKGVKFLSFPPVLHLQLMRFQYDPTTDQNTKINDRYEFPDILVLNEFIDEKDGEKDDDYTYMLHAVLVHIGTAQGGHYVVYINTGLTKETAEKVVAPNDYNNSTWYKFNDEVVSKAALREAVSANYGGEQTALENFRTVSYANAYMLVYVKKSLIDDVLCPVMPGDIPGYLKDRFELEKAQEEQRRKQREEESLFTELFLVTEENMRNHHGFDLFDQNSLASGDHNAIARLKVEKTMLLTELYDFVAKNLGLKITQFRLWAFSNINAELQTQFDFLESNRPSTIIHLQSIPVSSLLVHYLPWLFLEVHNMDSDTPEQRLEITDRHRLYFLKYYSHERKLPEYKGCILLPMDEVEELEKKPNHPKICRKLGISEDLSIKYYIDVTPNFFQIHELKKFLVCKNGIIIVVEDAEKTSEENCARSYYEALFYQTTIEFIDVIEGFASSDEAILPFKINIDVQRRLSEMCELIGAHIKHDPTKILLWRSFNGKPYGILKEDYNNDTVNEILEHSYEFTNHKNFSISLTDPRIDHQRKVFYSRLPITVNEYISWKKSVRIIVMNRKFKMKEITVYIARHGKIRDLLDEARKAWPFPDEDVGQIRCVQLLNHHRVIRVVNNEWPIQDMHKYCTQIKDPLIADPKDVRLEEIPRDQLEIGDDERLVPVAHYDKDKSRMFGVPFFTKIKEGETFATVHKRLMDRLEVPENDYKKYKFSIERSCTSIPLDPECDSPLIAEYWVVSAENYTAVTPYIGINHMNRMRGVKTGNNADKPIIIHN